MKSLLIAITIFFSLSDCFAKATLAEEAPRDSLLHIKKLIENQLSGSVIRDAKTEFTIERNTILDLYTFTSHISKTIQPNKIEELQDVLRKYLAVENNHSYNGIIYFDSHSDSAIVNIWPKKEHIFESAAIIMRPHGGISAFSRRFHDYLILQIEENKISKDEVMRIASVNFISEMDGSFTPSNDSALGDWLKEFLLKERRWSPGIMSGWPLRHKVTINIVHDYIWPKNPWPQKYEWASYQFLGYYANAGDEIFYTETKDHITTHQNVISLIYDPMLNTYRLPMVHRGSYEETHKLIKDIRNAGRQVIKGIGNSEYSRRIYFYRE